MLSARGGDEVAASWAFFRRGWICREEGASLSVPLELDGEGGDWIRTLEESAEEWALVLLPIADPALVPAEAEAGGHGWSPNGWPYIGKPGIFMGG